MTREDLRLARLLTCSPDALVRVSDRIHDLGYSGTTATLRFPSKILEVSPMKTSHRSLLWAALALAVASTLYAKGQAPANSPAQVVRNAVQNEVAPGGESAARFMFKNQRKTAHVSQTKLMVETREATAGLLIEQDGHPLSPPQQQAEEARLQNYIRNPEELSRKHKQEKEDEERTEHILRALPDAFLYEPDGSKQGTAAVGKPGDELVRLKFRPNPRYDPPSRVEQVLTGMQGYLLIDTRENRIAEINGTLEKEVGFGWGILGHLDRGGHFLVQQADIGNDQWELTQMQLDFTGKVLFFKKISIHSEDVFSDFRPVPANLTFAQGVELLKKHVTENGSSAANPAATPNRSRSQQRTPTQAQNQIKNQSQENLWCDR